MEIEKLVTTTRMKELSASTGMDVDFEFTSGKRVSKIYSDDGEVNYDLNFKEQFLLSSSELMPGVVVRTPKDMNESFIGNAYPTIEKTENGHAPNITYMTSTLLHADTDASMSDDSEFLAYTDGMVRLFSIESMESTCNIEVIK